MKRAGDFAEIYLCREHLDFRCGKEAMIAIIENRMHKRAISGALFGFTNRKRDRIRCLYWDKTGYAHWSKILEGNRFAWPEAGEGGVVTLTSRDLEWLLEGIDITKLRPHESRHYEVAS